MAAVELKNTTLFNDANLVSYYRLEDTSDSKGTNTLTNTNSVVFNPAKYNNGADFSSANTNKKLTSGNNIGIAGNDAISMVGWVKIYNTTDGGFVTHNSTINTDRYLIIKQDGSGNLVFIGAGISASTPFSDTSAFHHIAITRNGSGNILGYLDGSQVASFNAGASGLSTNNFEIGDINGGEFANAIIDDVAIFSRVLTAQEISDLFTGADATTTSTTTSTTTTSTSTTTTSTSTTTTTSTSTTTTSTSSSTTTSTSTTTTSTSSSTTTTSTSTTTTSTSTTTTSTSTTISTSSSTSTTTTWLYTAEISKNVVIPSGNIEEDTESAELNFTIERKTEQV